MFKRIDAGAPAEQDRQTPWGRPITVVGADIAGNALRYAERLGLHHASIASNLELAALTPEE